MREFVERVASRVRKAPRNANIKITVRHIFREQSRNGRVLPIKATRAAIDAQLDDPAAPRNVHVRLRTAKPKVTFATTSPASTTRSSPSTARTSSCASSRA